MERYCAIMGGAQWKRPPAAWFKTIRECRAWAESFGSTADYCVIETRNRRKVGLHVRDTSGDGSRWIRATI